MIEKYFALKYCEEIVGWSVVFMFLGFWLLVIVLYIIGSAFKKLQNRRKR